MFRTRYNHATPVSPCGGQSMTDPQFVRDCDINNILASFRAGKLLPANNPVQYGDFSEVTDFASALEKVEAAKNVFASLPASIRARFGHDVTAFMEFAGDPANFDECRKIGVFGADLMLPNVEVESNDNVTPPEQPPIDNGGGNAPANT